MNCLSVEASASAVVKSKRLTPPIGRRTVFGGQRLPFTAGGFYRNNRVFGVHFQDGGTHAVIQVEIVFYRVTIVLQQQGFVAAGVGAADGGVEKVFRDG